MTNPTDKTVLHLNSPHDRAMLRATRGATFAAFLAVIAAFVGVGVGAWFNRETVNIARDTLAESTKTRDDQRSQFETQRKDAATERDQEQQHFEEGKRQETRKVEAHEAEQGRIERLARSPLLVQYQCCNPVAVVFEHKPDGSRFVRKPRPDEFSFFPANYNKDHVIQIANFGQGHALRVNATWHPEKIKFTNGTERKISSTFGAYDLQPLHLKAGEHGFIQKLPPDCYREDEPSVDGNRLADVEGYLELNCDDNANEKRTFEYNFDLKIYCNIYRIGRGITAGAMVVNIAKDETNKPSVPQNAPETRAVKTESKGPDLADEKKRETKRSAK
jgi:hypothetical protein